MIEAHLPVLQVAVPLILAPACALFKDGRAAWFIAVCGSAWTLLCAALLLAAVQHGPLDYAIGGWQPPWGIAYRIDRINSFVLLLVGMIATMVAVYAPRSVNDEIAPERRSLFYSAYLLCLAGLLGIAATGDAFNLFVFLEISSLSSYAMIAMGKDRRALTASFQYLIMGTIGATFILIGVGLAYMMTGTLNMADLAARIPEVSDTTTIRAAFAFLTVGISLKIALLPLHLWLPNAYTFAPSVVTALLAATATKVSLYVLLRFFFTVFGVEFSFTEMRLDLVLLPLSLLAIIAASLVAVFQDNVKRMLAYSSVAQIGYMTLGISLSNLTGLTAAIVHLFNHALMKGALFLTLGCVMYRIGSVHIAQFAGLGRDMPWTMAAFAAGGLSLIGVPLTVGFISKWLLILAALENGWWPVAVLIVAASLLAVAYVWRIVEPAYFKASPAQSVRREAPLSLLLPTWVLVVANVYFGLDTTLTADLASLAAAELMQVTL